MNFKQAIAENKTISTVTTNVWKAGPTIAFVAGAVGSACSLYLTWRAARKHDEVMADICDNLDDVHAQKPSVVESDEQEDALPTAEYRKLLVKAYIQAGFKLGKLYAPAAVCEIGSLWLMGYGYGSLHARYTSTLAMVSVVENAFAKYRKNVVDILGEDADQEFRYGLKNKEFEVPELDKNGNPKTDKNGEVKTKKVMERVLEDGLEGYSGYARIYGPGYTKQCEGDELTGLATDYYNKQFLVQKENYWNMILKYRPNHTVFLNEVYVDLGYEPTKEGQVVGWHYDPDHPVGDNKIMFVPIEFYDEKYRAKYAIIDFNVDGNVWEFL